MGKAILKDGDTRMTVVLPRELSDEFRRLALLNERTLSGEVRRLMREYVEREREAA